MQKKMIFMKYEWRKIEKEIYLPSTNPFKVDIS